MIIDDVSVAQRRCTLPTMNTTLTLTIHVPTENTDEVFDAVNETLNSLAREHVLVDDTDDAWAWS